LAFYPYFRDCFPYCEEKTKEKETC
jgi:hypothetical protein